MSVSRDTHVLRGLARSLFLLGALVSLGDGLTTWYVLERVGLDKEGNPWMAHAMGYLGIGTVCALRVVVGVIAFWFLSRHIIGRYSRIGRRRRRRLVRWERTTLSRLDRIWRCWDRHSASIEFSTAIIITALVVGNNLRAVLTLV